MMRLWKWLAELRRTRKPETTRSPRWKEVRAMHLRDNPRCEVCGTSERLEVHHIIPVHIAPSLELESANLITLCEKYGHHWLFGHCQDWRAYNPEVRRWAAMIRKMLLEKRYEP